MSVSYCMLTVIWWCLCCYLLIIYCNKLYKSFCFWWWNRNEKQKYNTDINICTNKSRPFIHETEHARYMQSSSFGLKKLAPCKIFSWLLNWLLTFKIGTWRFFWFLLFGRQSSPCVRPDYYIYNYMKDIKNKWSINDIWWFIDNKLRNSLILCLQFVSTLFYSYQAYIESA